MKHYIAFISLVAGWSSAVVAQDVITVEDLTPACYWLAHAQTGRDVAYVPGVDAYGGAVVPADLNAPTFPEPEFVEFNILVDLADDLPAGFLPVEAQHRVATIRVETRTGLVWIDGELYEGEGDVDLAAHCGEEEVGIVRPRQTPARLPIQDVEE